MCPNDIIMLWCAIKQIQTYMKTWKLMVLKKKIKDKIPIYIYLHN